MAIKKIKHCACFPVLVHQYRDALKEGKLKYVCNEGGSRSGKTFDFFLFAFWYALNNRGKKKIIRVFRQNNTTCFTNTFLADFMSAISAFGIESQFYIRNGFARCYDTDIYFGGLYKGGEVNEATHSDILFFNEAMECDKTLVDKWLMRCRELAVFDWNPAATTHWVFDFEFNPDCVFTHTTYKDNPNLEQSVIGTIESYEPTERNITNGTADEYLWNVYGLGLRSEAVGMMYTGFKEYEELPVVTHSVKKCYIDTADTGEDFLCAIFYTETELGCFVTDVIYTKKEMEYTETLTARKIVENGTQEVLVEANNGGRGFARNVEANLRKLGNFSCTISTFNQGANKITRILTNSATAQNMVHFPSDWKKRFFEFSRDLLAFKREGRNAHDDAPDALTGVVENYQIRRLFKQFTFHTESPVGSEFYIATVKLEGQPTASVVYQSYDNILYVRDVVYTNEPLSTTLALIKQQLKDWKPKYSNWYVPKEMYDFRTEVMSETGTQIRVYGELSQNHSDFIVTHRKYVENLISYPESERDSAYLREKQLFVEGAECQNLTGLLADTLAGKFCERMGIIHQ